MSARYRARSQQANRVLLLVDRSGNGGRATEVLSAATGTVRTLAQHAAVPSSSRRLVVWTDHALVKAELLSVPRADIEHVVLTRHERRSRNTGAADWLVVAGRLAVAYNHPADGDELTA